MQGLRFHTLLLGHTAQNSRKQALDSDWLAGNVDQDKIFFREEIN